ncbi:hypothetical protein RFI_05580 [Reticulomyxa filosa]|uniref:C2H2-type domain-containing protein n=1 Tax=Reticulomyxa filosa TaxID=46433 RepID=X6NZ08_RETFI|nr:hypothetical protein RFI_05580 [Reticulomyxa filosa]|eukprot:ETO31540.1 hypothetical protein RFI_05580 [Reticulomyxa filosa]
MCVCKQSKHQLLPDLNDFLKNYNHGILLEADNCLLYQLDAKDVIQEFLSDNSDGMMIKVGVVSFFFFFFVCLFLGKGEEREISIMQQTTDQKYFICVDCGKSYREIAKPIPWLLGHSKEHDFQPIQLCGLCFTEAHKEAIDSARINIHEYVEANLNTPTQAMELCLVHRLFTTSRSFFTLFLFYFVLFLDRKKKFSFFFFFKKKWDFKKKKKDLKNDKNSRLMLTLANEFQYMWKNRREDHKKMLQIINL